MGIFLEGIGSSDQKNQGKEVPFEFCHPLLRGIKQIADHYVHTDDKDQQCTQPRDSLSCGTTDMIQYGNGTFDRGFFESNEKIIKSVKSL